MLQPGENQGFGAKTRDRLAFKGLALSPAADFDAVLVGCDTGLFALRRDTGEKTQHRLDTVVAGVPAVLEAIQADLHAAARRRRDERTAEVTTLEEAREAAQTGFARIPWATLGEAGEAKLAEDAVTVRCLQTPDGEVPANEDEPDVVAVVARAY